jgi:hypothetical protein
LSFCTTQALSKELPGVEISHGAIALNPQEISAALEQPIQEALGVGHGDRRDHYSFDNHIPLEQCPLLNVVDGLSVIQDQIRAWPRNSQGVRSGRSCTVVEDLCRM